MSTECATIHRISHGLQPHRYGYEDMPCVIFLKMANEVTDITVLYA